jgi:hypothetical protein
MGCKREIALELGRTREQVILPDHVVLKIWAHERFVFAPELGQPSWIVRAQRFNGGEPRPGFKEVRARSERVSNLSYSGKYHLDLR